jgi:transcriptional regulator with XRE-family HTH domain
MSSPLAEIRREKGIGQQVLTDRSGISERTIRRIETDPDYNPGLRTLARIAAVLGVQVSDLIHDSEADTPATTHGKPNGGAAAGRRSTPVVSKGA